MRQRWSNWAGNQAATGIDIRHPRDAADVSALVVDAVRVGRRVRPVGSGHSFSAIAQPIDVQVVLDQCADLIRIDAVSGLVTVGAGMTLARLNRLLTRAGLAMTNLGDVDVQTVAGALATGTHGTGTRFGGLATQVRALEIVLADGSIHECSPTHDSESFAAASIGLGALGIVTAVTLQTVPLFALRAEESPIPLDDVLAGFDELIEAPDHAEFFWFPHTARTLVKSNTRVPVDGGLRPLSRLRRWHDDELLSNTVFGGLLATGRRFPGLIRPINRVSSRALGARTFTDLSHAVFTSPRRVRFVEMEYAVPRSELVAVVRELRNAIERSGLRISMPVEVRTAAPDNIPLSTSYGRESGYVAVHMERGSSPDEYFALVESIVGAVDGRPHWGKMHTRSADEFRGLYPRFDDFLAVRDAVDPGGVFANRYLDRVLGSAPGAVPTWSSTPGQTTDSCPGGVDRF
ncbi:MAG: D-arabinono-1,4-lactone oxidase [Frankia sp.]